EKFKQLIKEEIKMAECKFEDISGHYGEKQIREVFEMGIMNGVDETHFEPDKPVTRAQAAIIARNVVRYIMGK
ncbi:S-layer homology domain-containing protein, partial [Congzhengia sp.]|uniref:S-layer homology domain-containing protein n=1 Tax=Congzhengia sp. TaxID=2944168 RepID=UPI0030778C18